MRPTAMIMTAGSTRSTNTDPLRAWGVHHPRMPRVTLVLALALTVAGCSRDAFTLADCLDEHGDTVADEGIASSVGSSGADPTTWGSDTGADTGFPEDPIPLPVDPSCRDGNVDPGEVCYELEIKSAGIDPCDIALHDFDRDGNPDLAVPNSDPNINDGRYVANVLFGDGARTAPAEAFEVGGPLPVRIATGDFDGDMAPDFAIANSGAYHVTFKRGDGNGGFATPMQFGTELPANSMAAGDLDGDGRDELLVGSTGSIVEVVFTSPLGPGQPSLDLPGTVMDVQAIDLDGDGRDSVAVAVNDGSLALYDFADGDEGFVAGQVLAATYALEAIVRADIDGDGDEDLLGVDTTQNLLCVFENQGGQLVWTTSQSLDFQPRDLTVNDFDRDGRLDLAISDVSYDRAVVLTQLPAPGPGSELRFEERFAYTTGDYPVALVSADFNHDGVPDIATADQYSNRISLFVSVP